MFLDQFYSLNINLNQLIDNFLQQQAPSYEPNLV